MVAADPVYGEECGMHAPTHEDKRLTEYRNRLRLENSLGSLKVFCGGACGDCFQLGATTRNGT